MVIRATKEVSSIRRIKFYLRYSKNMPMHRIRDNVFRRTSLNINSYQKTIPEYSSMVMWCSIEYLMKARSTYLDYLCRISASHSFRRPFSIRIIISTPEHFE